jgi:hypothetical protein
MNERIRELAIEARLLTGWPVGEVEYQKFAKLIVQECMNVLDPGENQLIARFQARQWLAEHFGMYN